jgi:hypothetical protein
MNRKQWLVVLGAAVAAFNIVMYLIDPSMQSKGPEIIAFEFAGSKTHTSEIMAEWGTDGRSAARLSLWIDYGYMISYGAFFTLAGLATSDLARQRNWRRLAAAGTIVPFFAATAAIFDASENIALLLTLSGHGGTFAPVFATVCSSIKFTLIAIAIGYVLLGLAMRLRTRAPATMLR